MVVAVGGHGANWLGEQAPRTWGMGEWSQRIQGAHVRCGGVPAKCGEGEADQDGLREDERVLKDVELEKEASVPAPPGAAEKPRMSTHGELDRVLYGLGRGEVDVVHRETRAGLALAGEMLRRRNVHAGHGADSKGKLWSSSVRGIDVLTPKKRARMTLQRTSPTTEYFTRERS